VVAQISCGDAPKDVPVNTQDSLKGDVEGKAQLFTKLLGNANIKGTVDTSRTELYEHHQNLDQHQIDMMLMWVSCQTISADKNLSTPDKLKLWLEVYSAISRHSAAPVYPDQRQTEHQKDLAATEASPLQQAREALETNLWQGQYFCDGGVADVRLTKVSVTPDGALHGDIRGMMQFTVVQGQPRVPTSPIAVEGDLKIETGLRRTGLLILFPLAHPLKEPQNYTMSLDLQSGTLTDENVSQGDVSNCVHKSKLILFRSHTP
jgi:hypothetical protein